MPKKTQRRNNKRGSGYLMPAEYFNPSALQPSSNAPALTTAPSPGFVRPPLSATTSVTQTGGKRKTRSHRGGFAPAIMGSFVANAQAFATPLALLGLYTAFGVKRNATRTNKNKQ